MKPLSPDMFIRQRDDYSCAAACLATVAALRGVEGDYDFFRALLAPDPASGVPCEALAAAAQAYLGATGSGEGVYSGGLAVACIFDGEGHYVVFLGASGECVFYYDPYDHVIIERSISGLDWRSEAEDLREWCVNFPPFPGQEGADWRGLAEVLRAAKA